MYKAEEERVERELDLVRQEYKRYKKKKPPPDLGEVLDFSSEASISKYSDRVSVAEDVVCSGLEADVGLKCAKSWRVYRVSECPGLMCISNPFTDAGQEYWMHQSLTTYTKQPYPSNIDIHVERNSNSSIWETSKIERTASPPVKEAETSMGRLRWVHLGYHFDYNVVKYKSERYYGFPGDLKALMKCIAHCLGFPLYNPETAIINYYPIGSSMGGHTDHYEEDLHQPLLSISFGQPAIFLIGSDTRTTKPAALWLRSGDIVVMSGASRLAYHAVPAIMKAHNCTFFKQPAANDGRRSPEKETCRGSDEVGHCHNDNDLTRGHIAFLPEMDDYIAALHDNAESGLLSDYLSNVRININVRQVHKGTTKPQ